MYQTSDLPTTSMKSLLSTIKIDKYVYRWFIYLISQKKFQEEWINNDEIKRLYKKKERILLQERIVYGLTLIGFFFIVITGQFEYIFLIFILIGSKGFLNLEKKKCVLTLCRIFIQNDFNKFKFSQKTLYQIGEFYSRKYAVTSLLQTVTFVNSGIRKTVLYMFIFATFIVPLNFWYTCGYVFMAYYVFYEAMNMSFVYKRIK